MTLNVQSTHVYFTKSDNCQHVETSCFIVMLRLCHSETDVALLGHEMAQYCRNDVTFQDVFSIPYSNFSNPKELHHQVVPFFKLNVIVKE